MTVITETVELNKIYNEDCLQGLKRIPDNSVDLVVTDPPYGIDLKPQRRSSKWKDTVVKNDDTLEWVSEFVDDLYRVLKNDSAVFCFCSWKKVDVFMKEFDRKFELKNMIVWNKDWFGMGNNFRPNHEFIILATKGKYKTKSNNLSNILTYRRIAPQKLKHSCEKPVSLIELLINESSNEGQTVLDPFMGSGTTAVACLNTDRNYIGFELDSEYHRFSEERIAAHKEQIQSEKEG